MMIIKKTRNNKCWQRSGEKGTLVHCEYSGAATTKNNLEVINGSFRNRTIILYSNSGLGIYLKKMKIVTLKDIYTPMFIAAIFTIAKIWKLPKCQLMVKCIKKKYSITQSLKSNEIIKKNKQMGPNQTEKLLHSKGNPKQRKKTTHRMGENICK